MNRIRTMALFVPGLLLLAGCTVSSTNPQADGGDAGSSVPDGSTPADGGATTDGGQGADSATDAGGHDGASHTDGGAEGGAGDGSSGGGDGGSVGEGCAPETTPNDTREQATPYVLGTNYLGCMHTEADVDYYQFTMPATPVQGGYVKVSITDVGDNGSIDISAWAAANNGEFESAYGTSPGQSTYLWFAGKPGATFRIEVKRWASSGGDKQNKYTLNATFYGVDDTHSPNNDRASAKPLTLGTPVKGYFFAGLEQSTPPNDAAWDDWYKVHLTTGNATITLNDFASDISGDVTLFDSNGAQVDRTYETTGGAAVIMTRTVTEGDYYVRIGPWLEKPLHGDGSTIPEWLTKPYTLTVAVQ